MTIALFVLMVYLGGFFVIPLSFLWLNSKTRWVTKNFVKNNPEVFIPIVPAVIMWPLILPIGLLVLIFYVAYQTFMPE